MAVAEGSVEEARNRQLLTEATGTSVPGAHGIVHGGAPEWDEGDHVDQSDARVDAGVMPEIVRLDGGPAERQHRLDQLLGLPDDRKNAAMVVAVLVEIKATPRGGGEFAKPRGVSAFADVDHRLEDGIRTLHAG